MKKFIFFSMVIFISCSKATNKPDESKLPLAGKWVLTATLDDPGDGSGKWTAVDKSDFYFVQFNADKTVQTNMFGRFERAKKYENSDSTVTLIYPEGGLILLYYKIEDSYLTITGGCYEACGSKFKTAYKE